MPPFPLRKTWVVRINGQRYGSIQRFPWQDDKEAEDRAELYFAAVKAKFHGNYGDSRDNVMVDMIVTHEPDRYLEGQFLVNLYDR